MLPNGWSLQPIKDICESIVDCVNKTAPVVDYVTPFRMIRTTNVRHGRVDVESVRYVTEATFKEWTRRGLLNIGDVIFTREAPVGEIGILEDADGVFLGQRLMMYRADRLKSTNQFLAYALQSKFCQKQIENFSNGGTVAHMRVPDCGEVLIKTPPLPEQIKIAEILSTWDNAINTVQKLLANRQQQKKSLMQQLLTGKKRFAGFEGEWEEKRLGDVCSPQQWPTISSKDLVSNGYSVYGANGFIGYYFEYNHKNETVAVTCRGSTCGEVSLIPEKSYVTGNSMCLDDVNEKRYAYRYLYYFLKNRGFNDVISGSAQPQIVGSAIRKVKVLIPSLPEQQKIATILTTADQEIDNLRAQLNHLKQEKKALMQQLLTGKRRVKIEEAA